MAKFDMTNKTPKGHMAFLILGALALLFFMHALVENVASVLRGRQSAAWPSVEGGVIASSAVRGCGRGASYYPDIRYVYDIGSKRYQGETIALGVRPCGREKDAEELAYQYPIGERVRVYVNPDAANDAVLIPGKATDETVTRVWIDAVALCCIGALLISVQVLRRRKRRTTPPLS